MARKSGNGRKNTGTGEPRKKLENYDHPQNTRRTIPTEQSSKYVDKALKKPVEYKVPKRSVSGITLSWDRAEDLKTGSVSSTPLYIHEKIHPMGFIESLRSDTPRQSKLFAEYDGISKDDKYKFYSHRGKWQNRIIRGSSLEVMASLMEKEDMAGKVQMIYFDPPYGMDFSAMLQVNSKKQNVGDVPIDTVSIKAFRDTYSKDVHSYLDNIYRILVHTRNLLTESGSIFLQINSKNLHYIGTVLDEAFGHENRVRLITYMTKAGGSSDIIPDSATYILWYAKNIKKIKSNILYEEKTGKEMVEFMTSYVMVEKADGTSRNLTKPEKEDPCLIPQDELLFKRERLTSQGTGKDERSEPYYCVSMEKEFKCPAGEHWRVSKKGIDKLDELNRLVAVESGRLGWKLYASEIPGKSLSNVWPFQMSAKDKHYVVETAEAIIERCMLMTTEPGDLVYDPTCGSGTTAYVAEKWGRRWITSDVSSISTTLTRQRIATAIFKYYHLIDTEDGINLENETRKKLGLRPLPVHKNFESDPGKGFVYKKFPYVSAASLAYQQTDKFISIVDKPYENTKIKRVSSPFTVETLSPYRYIEPNVLVERAKMDAAYGHVRDRVLDALEKSGFLVDNERIHVSDITPDPKGMCLTHTCIMEGEKYAILIAPPDCTIPKEMIINAADQAAESQQNDGLLVIGFNYEDGARSSPRYKLGRFKILLINSSMDMQIEGLLAKGDDSTLQLIGEPAVDIIRHDTDDDLIAVKVIGFETYNPKARNVVSGTEDNLICWMIDTDYDSHSFFARLLHFPNLKNDRQLINFRKQLESIIDEELWERTTSNRSMFFKRPSTGKIAVRIITETNMEMSSVIEMGEQDEILYSDAIDNVNNNSDNDTDITAECPECGKTALGIDEVRKEFGLRKVNGIERVQSWCTDCRKNKRTKK